MDKRETWKECTKGPAIISDKPTRWSDPYNKEYFGGYLVCESVDPRCMPLILAAPRLLEALEDARKYIGNGWHNDHAGPDAHVHTMLVDKIDKAIAAARGEQLGCEEANNV